MTERWAVIPLCPTYQASDAGRIRHAVRGNVLKPRPDSFGYLYFSCCINGRRHRRSFKVHSCVLAAFVGPRLPGTVGRHLNGDHADNRLANLGYATQRENIADKWKHGTMPVGQRHHMARLTDGQVAEVRALYVRGSSALGTIGLARRFGVSTNNIQDIISGRTRTRRKDSP